MEISGFKKRVGMKPRTSALQSVVAGVSIFTGPLREISFAGLIRERNSVERLEREIAELKQKYPKLHAALSESKPSVPTA